MKPNPKRILCVSYHFFEHSSYRPSVMHDFLSRYALANHVEYVFLCSNWDHISKKNHSVDVSKNIHMIRVPGYKKNISFSRIFSHLIFSFKLLFHPSLWRFDVCLVCVPPSFSYVVALIAAKVRRKPVIVDVVDLWPEALPLPRVLKNGFMFFVGAPWIFFRNFFYSRATRLLSHCKYFLTCLHRHDDPKASYLPLTQQDLSLFEIPSHREKIDQQIRILVLGSINHVLDIQSLVRILMDLSGLGKEPKVVLEIVGSGENKANLLEAISHQAPKVDVIDHGVIFEPVQKAKILSRCHFGYNGYRQTSAIGITYKSIDFSSAAVVFLNSLQGDLNDLVDEYGAGFNYKIGKEKELVQKILALKTKDFELMSQASRKMARDLFHPSRFENQLGSVLGDMLKESVHGST